MEYWKKIIECSDFLKSKLGSTPEIGIVAGTGLGDCANSVKETFRIKYSKIPNFPVSTVESHDGELVFGEIEEKKVVIMRGRLHLYEGYSPKEVTFPIRVMQSLGVKNIIITNASGGLNLSFNEGDIMVIRDHVNLTGSNPLTGGNDEKWGLRFPDMINAYDIYLADAALMAGKELGISVKKGVYTGLLGPSLETPAEMRFLKIIGGDAVGFSTIHEVITAVHAGMKILGLSVIANLNDPDKPEAATLESVVSVVKKCAPSLDALIGKVISVLDTDN